MFPVTLLLEVRLEFIWLQKNNPKKTIVYNIVLFRLYFHLLMCACNFHFAPLVQERHAYQEELKVCSIHNTWRISDSLPCEKMTEINK